MFLPSPQPTPLAPPATKKTRDALGDVRFRRLLGADVWAALPLAVRRRFGKRLIGNASVTYSGHIVETRFNWAGRALTQLARLIGAPLPLMAECGQVKRPAVVIVTEDPGTDGQNWTRIYGRPGGFPQVVHSAKRFAGPTGLEEYVGHGIGMALTVSADHAALRFTSAGYFLKILGRRWNLPRWMTPGTMTVSHEDLGDGKFAFVLDLVHPRFGTLIRQTIHFQDPVEV